MTSGAVTSATSATSATPTLEQIEGHRRELTAYCYRMLGSPFEADDAVQETITRAWKAIDGFEGRSSLRSWLYRIASNVCFDHLRAGQRRARPMDLTEPATWDRPMGAPLGEQTWVQPMPDARVVSAAADPAEQTIQRDSIRLAFVAALQFLPPRQRAVLILREVLRWEATEVAELLESTVASVNSALQRARATLSAKGESVHTDSPAPMTAAQEALLAKYVEAFLRYDVDSLVALLHSDATLSMPPFAFWLHGRAEALRWWNSPGPQECRGSRLVPIEVNGTAGFAQYRRAADGTFFAWGVQVLDLTVDQDAESYAIAAIDFHLNVGELFPLFGLPLVLNASGDGD
jgi:RNA polymerase sigma-70 factor (ECF subfamily)